MATELEWLRDALLYAIDSSPDAAERVAEVLEEASPPMAAGDWIQHRTGEPAPRGMLRSLSLLRLADSRSYSELRAIAAEYALAAPSTGTASGVTAGGARSVAASGDIGVAVTGDHAVATYVTGDHVDFRDSTFRDRVVGVQHNHYGTAPAAAAGRRVRQVGPLEFGVRPTRPVPGLPPVPPYVPRDCDEELQAKLFVRSLVLILGEPCAGRSYTAWNAVRSLKGHRLYAPDPGEDLRPLVTALQNNPGKYVIWLDELTGHLGAGGLDQRLLGRLNDLGAVVLATMTPAEYYRRRIGTAPGDLVVAAARTVELAREWSEAELERLAADEDPRAYPAYMWSGREGAALYFAVGHLLFDEWRRVGTQLEHPRGQLLVRAAVDLARCGVTAAVPAELLGKVQEEYRAEERESFEDALAWATAPMFGVSGLLVAGAEDGTWRAYGALVAEALRSGDLEPVPDEVWWTLLDAAREPDAPLDFPALLDAARTALRPRVEAGDAVVALGLARRTEGDEREEWLRRAAGAGDPRAAVELAKILRERGDTKGAEALLEVAAEAGDGYASTLLGELLLDRAERWLTKGAEEGRLEAAHQLGDLLFVRGRDDAAYLHYSAAVDAGYVKAARSVGLFMLAGGEYKVGQIWLRRAVAAGDESAFEALADARTPDSWAEAEDFFDKPGHPLHTVHFGNVREAQGHLDEARSLYLAGYELGDAYGAYCLATLFEKLGNPEKAAHWCRKAAEMGLPAARKALAEKPDTVKE
ncbi:hypothetical protein [Streptomyces viridochromogenes]|uniref:hypothetical protein n=1 Tax=Streptomyces viridochromogenes TaxID=1938 RepID=UPI001319FDEE|nr:hypothetical protein [Streptomyces viridochromogenes]